MASPYGWRRRLRGDRHFEQIVWDSPSASIAPASRALQPALAAQHRRSISPRADNPSSGNCGAGSSRTCSPRRLRPAQAHRPAVERFHDVLVERHRRAATIITITARWTNGWPLLTIPSSPNSATLDRFARRAHQTVMEGPSLRAASARARPRASANQRIGPLQSRLPAPERTCSGQRLMP